MSTCTVTISGSTVTLQEGTLQITSRVDDKDKATFTVIDSSGTAAYTKGQPVRITDSSLGLLFSGFINKPTATNLFPSSTTLWSVDCVNKFVVAAKKATKPPSTTTGRKHHRGGKHKNQHSGTIAALQIQEYMEPEGVSGNFGLDWSELQSDWQSGTLSGVAATTNTSTGNVGSGDLELSPGGTPVTYTAPSGFLPAQSNAIAFIGYASSGYTAPTCVRQIWSGSQVIASSDAFQFDVWISSTSPQIVATADFSCSDGTTLDSQTVIDVKQGLSAAWTTDLSGNANDQWYTRTFIVPAGLVGKTLTSVNLVLAGTQAGTYSAYFKNILYNIHAGGSITIFGANSTLTTNNQLQNTGYTNVSCTQVVVTAQKVYQDPVGVLSFLYSAVNIVQSSQIAWTQVVGSGCTILIETTIDNGASYQTATSGSAVANLLPGMKINTVNLGYRLTLTAGTDPTATMSVSNLTITIIPAYTTTKSDTVTSFGNATGATAFNAAGTTLTNTVLNGSNQLTISGFQRNFDSGASSISDQVFYSSGGSGSVTVENKQLSMSLGTSAEFRSELTAAGQWQNFTAEMDISFNAANVQAGLVYRTTGWQNNNDTYAYVVTVNTAQVQLGRGTNSASGAGTFTSIATVSLALAVNSTHRLKLVINGSNHKVYLDSVLLINATDATWSAAGYFGFRGLNAGGTTQIATFDNFGVVPSLSGTWQSSSINIAGPGTYGGSLVQWDTDNLPDNTATISVQTSVDSGSTFQSVTNGGAIANLTNGQSLTGKTLILLVTLTASTAPTAPTMNGISAWVMGQYTSTGSRSNAPMVWDSMTRLNVGSGWSNASNGEAYTQSGTATTAVTSNEATISNTSGDCHMVPASPTSTDEDGSVRFKLSASTISAGMELRYTDANTFYRLKISTTAITISIRVAGTDYQIATASVSLSTGTFYWMRFRVTGSGPVTSFGRVWLDGTTEPTTWNVTGTS